jgi:hypothetical protein
VTRPIQIVPSVLPADFARLGDEVAALEAAGVDLIQWDVMDGQFVPNLTFGPDVIAAARKHCTVPFEAHLMVYTPDVMAQQYVDAGCSRLIVHAEACTHLHRTLDSISSMGARAAVALNPATPASAGEHVLDVVDLVLVMTVNPGFGLEPRPTTGRDSPVPGISRRGSAGWAAAGARPDSPMAPASLSAVLRSKWSGFIRQAYHPSCRGRRRRRRPGRHRG